MASTYNGSVANLVDPLANSPLNSPSHAGQHTEINDALQTLGTWTSFTPTWTSLTVGNATQDFRYTLFNKFMAVYGKITLGSTSSVGSDPRFNIPESKSALVTTYAMTNLLEGGVDNFQGSVMARDSQIFLQWWGLVGTTMRIRGVSATGPFTWGATDEMTFNIVFPII